MNCKGCGLPMTPEEMGVNFKGEKQEYHGFQAKCVELLQDKLNEKDLQIEMLKKGKDDETLRSRYWEDRWFAQGAELGTANQLVDGVKKIVDVARPVPHADTCDCWACVIGRILTPEVKRICEHSWELQKSHGPWPETNRCTKCGTTE